jgi:hypothetical protein
MIYIGACIAISILSLFFLTRFSRTHDPEDGKPYDNVEESSERLVLRDYETIWQKEVEL